MLNVDENKLLILDIRKEPYRDLTRHVYSIDKQNNSIGIISLSGSKYNYDKKDILVLDNPKEITTDIAIDEYIDLSIERKLQFGKFLKLFFCLNLRTELHYLNIEILDSNLHSLLTYFYNVASRIKSLPATNSNYPTNNIVPETISNILHQKISIKSPLFSYLAGKVLPAQNQAIKFIFPFQCNESQLKAIEQTFSNPLSLIQGPPGTGKTQTILNILANAVLSKKRVAVVSSNNSAIQNIVDKLKDADGLDFLCAMLGNKTNVNKFKNTPIIYPDWLYKKSILPSGIETDLQKLTSEIKQLYAMQNIQKQKQTKLNAWRIEFEKFSQCYPDVQNIPDIQNTRMTSKKLLKLFITCNFENIKREKLSFWFKLKNVLFYRRWSFSFWNQPLVKVLATLKILFYQQKISELEQEIDKLSQQLTAANFEEKNRLLSTISWQILKHKLQETYSYIKKDKQQTQRKNINDHSKYPIILSTTFMIQKYASPQFDLLIIDEASQVDLCTGIIALSCAKNVVIVGDDKQLPCVISTEDEKDLKELNASTQIDKKYLYQKGQSILTSIQQAIPNIPNVTLCEHYRCDPYIINFCNKCFYDNKLIIHSKRDNSVPLTILLTKPSAQGHFNPRQDAEIKKFIKENGYSENDIMYCTPFCEHAQKTGAATIHKCQGREKDIVIMSTVENNITKFVADKQLMNVAISRAKKKFCLVIASSNKNWNNCIGDLIHYIEYHDNSSQAISQGKTTSIFDMLYEEYQFQIPSYEKYYFASKAEKIMYQCLTEIIQEYDTDKRYEFSMHIPLYEIFKPGDDLTANENEFLSNKFSHVDFLVYEKFGMTPYFAIEVDGYSYHKPGTKQAKRDEIKNSIFQKRGIRLERFNTTGYNECSRLIDLIKPK